MNDKNWLLNPTAIHAAKDCIQIIQDELGIRLKLSHPQFLEMIQEYVELTESDMLQQAYLQLAQLAGIRITQARILKPAATVVDMPVTHRSTVTTDASVAREQETISYHGKLYKRFDGDREFRGLYRGQPRYA
ncbi:MAG TPA: hypothetical protein VIN71_11245 [Pseudomonadales bacterium]